MRNRGRKKGALTVDPSPVLPRLGIDSPGPASGAFRKAAGGKLPACDALVESAGAPVGAPSRDSRNARGSRLGHVPAPGAPGRQHRELAVAASCRPLQVEDMLEARDTNSLRRGAPEQALRNIRFSDFAHACSSHRQDTSLLRLDFARSRGMAALAHPCCGRDGFDHPFQPRLGAPHVAPSAAIVAALVPVNAARPGKIDQWPIRCSSTRHTRRRLGWSWYAAIAWRNSISSRQTAGS